MLSSYLYQHLCGYLCLNFQAYYYSSQICRVSWWAACFAQLPVGLPSLSSLLMGCLPSHRANWWATSTFPVKLTDGLPSMTSLLMARNKHPFMPKSFTVHAWNSLSMVKSNSNLTKSGRSAFIIPSRPLLKGGRVVLEHHPPTRFNMDEVYALYIFLPTFLDIRPIQNLCRFRTQVSGKQNNNFRVCGHTDSIPILPWMIMSESTTKLARNTC